MSRARDLEQRKSNRTNSSSSMEENCKSCSHPILKKDNVFNCISCSDVMHLTRACTGISEAAIMGIKEISQNILLICNECVKRNHRNTILNTLTQSRSELDQGKLTLMTEKFEGFKKEMESLKQSFEDMKITTKRQQPESTNVPTQKPMSQLAYDGIRLRGIEELKSKDSRERYEHDLEEVNKLFAFLTKNAKITDLKRLGKFEEDNTKPRTIIVKLSNECQKRLILVSLSKLKNYDKTVYVSKELNPNELQAENKLLKQRRELIDNGTQPSNLRIRELKLYKFDGCNWTPVEVTETEP